MPPSAGSRSEHSHHSGYDDDETLMLEQAMDKADRASNRLEVRHRIPPRRCTNEYIKTRALRAKLVPPLDGPSARPPEDARTRRLRTVCYPLVVSARKVLSL